MSDLPDLKHQKVPQSEFDAHKKKDGDAPKPKKSKSGDDKPDVGPPKANKQEDSDKAQEEEKQDEKKDQPAQKGSSCCLLI